MNFCEIVSGANKISSCSRRQRRWRRRRLPPWAVCILSLGVFLACAQMRKFLRVIQTKLDKENHAREREDTMS